MDASPNAAAADTGNAATGSVSGNVKTALVLLSVAAVFFLGVIANHILMG